MGHRSWCGPKRAVPGIQNCNDVTIQRLWVKLNENNQAKLAQIKLKADFVETVM